MHRGARAALGHLVAVEAGPAGELLLGRHGPLLEGESLPPQPVEEQAAQGQVLLEQVPPVQELPGDLDGGAQQVVGRLLGGLHAGAQVLDGPAEFKPNGAGCIVSFSFDMRPKAAMRLAFPLLRNTIAAQVKANIGRLPSAVAAAAQA